VKDQGDPLARIAQALECLVPQRRATPDWLASAGYVWERAGARAVEQLVAPPLALMRGIDAQKAAVVENVVRLASGAAAHDMLLWGSRGMGKSALLRAAVKAAQGEHRGALGLVQVSPGKLGDLAELFATLRQVERRFLVFLDDLGFDGGEAGEARHLRSWLEGGVEARPSNVRLAVTSNRRAIVERHVGEQDDPLNPRDVVDDRLALADRFGLSLGFHACGQDDYLAIVAGYADHYGLPWEAADALGWARRRGARSGRVAWQYVTELAGRSGRPLLVG
jgi:predicted AAA+ superfamily ATPase